MARAASGGGLRGRMDPNCCRRPKLKSDRPRPLGATVARQGRFTNRRAPCAMVDPLMLLARLAIALSPAPLYGPQIWKVRRSARDGFRRSRASRSSSRAFCAAGRLGRRFDAAARAGAAHHLRPAAAARRVVRSAEEARAAPASSAAAAAAAATTPPRATPPRRDRVAARIALPRVSAVWAAARPAVREFWQWDEFARSCARARARARASPLTRVARRARARARACHLAATSSGSSCSLGSASSACGACATSRSRRRSACSARSATIAARSSAELRGAARGGARASWSPLWCSATRRSLVAPRARAQTAPRVRTPPPSRARARARPSLAALRARACSQVPRHDARAAVQDVQHAPAARGRRADRPALLQRRVLAGGLVGPPAAI